VNIDTAVSVYNLTSKGNGKRHENLARATLGKRDPRRTRKKGNWKRKHKRSLSKKIVFQGDNLSKVMRGI